MTTQEAAERIGKISKGYVCKLIRDGRIKASWRTDCHGQQYRWITPRALAAYAETRKGRGRPKKTL